MSKTIVFFGSGPVAAESLAFLADKFEIEAVVTKPQPAHHKEDFPVLLLASKLGLKILETRNKQDLLGQFDTKPISSQLGVVIDYGIIIPKEVIDTFPLGIVNSHFSLLPEWRGADPISFTILSGQKQTGVSLMLINETLDEGPLLAQAPFELPTGITTPELTEQLIALSNTTLGHVLPLYIEGSVLPAPQTEATISGSSKPTYSRKLTKQDSILDFDKPAVQLEREIRAYLEWPRSRAKLGTTDVIITKAHVGDQQGKAGKIWQQDQQLGIHTSDGTLIIDSLIPAGKKQMPVDAFLRGYSPS